MYFFNKFLLRNQPTLVNHLLNTSRTDNRLRKNKIDFTVTHTHGHRASSQKKREKKTESI